MNRKYRYIEGFKHLCTHCTLRPGAIKGISTRKQWGINTNSSTRKHNFFPFFLCF